ncbi:MAG TPA: peptidoglycan DD-metalloendopeptidase family protein [Gemmatimonadota bacterium]|nr:peptidoglycan DD-metalloendopeptidase family protein [Gemmatimonadota bacterium]
MTSPRSSSRLLGWGLVAAVGCAPVYSATTATSPVYAPIYSDVTSNEPDREVSDAEINAGLVRALESLVWPLAADGVGLLSSSYGERIHPLAGEQRFHTGLDLRAREGTPVYASAAGRVTASGASGAYGNLVILDHGADLQTLYAHNSMNLVRVGDLVRRGQPVALVGHTGNATGDHVHFEVRWKGGTVDPRTVLPLLSGTVAR